MQAAPTAGNQSTRPDAELQRLRPPTVPFYTALPQPPHINLGYSHQGQEFSHHATELRKYP